MKVSILTRRAIHNGPHWQPEYEWEDIIKKELHASFRPYLAHKALEKYMPYFSKFHFYPSAPTLLIEMDPTARWTDLYNRPNIVPWIMDFYINSDKGLTEFYRNFDKHKVVLVSSLEACDFLKSKGCPLNIVHMPQTLSDKYRIDADTKYAKEFDVLLMGRCNSTLLSYLNIYQQKHPDLRVVSCKRENGRFNYYDNKGTFCGNADSRKDIVELLQKSRIGFYTQKGMEGDIISGNHPNGFCHVTQRLFEYMMTGNHIIAQYIDNVESKYYELSGLFPNTDNYDIFEVQMDKYLQSDVNMGTYADYLNKHYTSTLTESLKAIMESL